MSLTTKSDDTPTLGLLSHMIWRGTVLSDRIRDILDAMERYTWAGKVCPEEWIDELEMHFGFLANTPQFGSLIGNCRGLTAMGKAGDASVIQGIRLAFFGKTKTSQPQTAD